MFKSIWSFFFSDFCLGLFVIWVNWMVGFVVVVCFWYGRELISFFVELVFVLVCFCWAYSFHSLLCTFSAP